MNENTFQKQKQDAIRRMKEMNQKSEGEPPPPKPPEKSNSVFGGINLPFLDNLKSDGDATLILGILLLLFSEKADKKLLFALIYILL
jgi:hypothetical protein